MLKNPYFYTHIILSVVFISCFICIFFFTYATTVERNIVVNQTQNLVDSFTGNISVLFSDNESVKNFVQNMSVKTINEDDKRIKEKNQKILKEAAFVVGISAICLIILTIILIYLFKLNYKKLIITNLIVLLCIGIVEFSFLTFIAQNYISFDPNYVKYLLVENLERIKNS